MGDSVIEESAVERARAFASRVHADAVDKAGKPYIGHCERVAAKLASDDEKIVAMLHDVLEDTDTPEDELRAVFGDRIVESLRLLTRSADIAPAQYYARLKHDPVARAVKLADIHDNLDPARLSALDPQVASKLIAKYGDALQALAEV
ncbi:MAG: HD domain-containing protein [Actinobacteria bacterium]|nr:MAG: HD domain-containing protein [Actinomycetota bacterium]